MITTGSVRGWCSAPQFGHGAREAALDDVRLTAAGAAEAMPAVPVQQRRGVGDEPALGAGGGCAAAWRSDSRSPIGARGRLAAHAAGADHRHAPLAQRVLVDREQRPVLVEAEQQRLGAVELGQRDELEVPAHDPQAAVAGHDGARDRVRALLVQPRLVAAAGVARAVERRSGECVVHATCTLPSVGIRSALLTVALALILAAPAQAAPQVGIGDQHPAAFADPRLRALNLPVARMIVPWDAVTLAAGEGRRVAGGDARGGHGAAHRASSTSARTAAPARRACCRAGRSTAPPSNAFLARWPQVRTYTAWNEANHVSQPTARRPEAAAGYYDELRAACPACTIVAADILDSGSYMQLAARLPRGGLGRPAAVGSP